MNILILHLTYAEKYIHNIHHSTDLKKNNNTQKKRFHSYEKEYE